MPTQHADAVANAMWGTFMSPNVEDRNGEHADVVDALDHIAFALERIAAALESLSKREDERN